MNYRPEIDGMRAIAVLPVILFHAGLSGFSGGYIGVDIFFVISGYLITTIIAGEIGAGKFSIAKFYERRARRILPALFFVILCCLPFAWLWMLPSQLVFFGESMASVALFASNIFFWVNTDYFAPAAELNPLLHTWSLAVEEQFYLFFPIMLMIINKLLPRYLFLTIVIMCLGSLGVAQWGSVHASSANFFLIPTRMWELGIGALCALWLTNHRQGRSEIISTGAFIVVVATFFLFDEATPMPSVIGLLPVGGTALIILFCTPDTIVGRVLASPVPVRIGLISYSAYLWHQPIFAFARIKMTEEPSTAAFLAMSALALVLAYISWRFVERPFRSGPDSKVKKQSSIFILSVAGLAALVGIGLWFVKTEGGLFRYLEADRHIYKTIGNPTAGLYVGKNFKDHNHQPFDPAKQKLLIVGDSFAQDFTNIFLESGIADAWSVSTHYIPTKCGNLLVDNDLTVHIPPGAHQICDKTDRYRSNQLRDLMQQADIIAMASMWRDWEAGYLKRSLANIAEITDAKIVLIGRKNFHRFGREELVSIAVKDRPSLRYPMYNWHVKLDNVMRQLPNFVDMMSLLCANGSHCRIFTPDGKLISYDGAHLTEDGARYLGRKLTTESAVFRSVFVNRETGN